MSLKERVETLEERVKKLEASVKWLSENTSSRRDMYEKTTIQYPKVVSGDEIVRMGDIDVTMVVQMFLEHAGLQIKRTPEKVSLEIANAKPVKNNPRD